MDTKKEALKDEELKEVAGGSVIETEEPFLYSPSDEALWELGRIYSYDPEHSGPQSVIPGAGLNHNFRQPPDPELIELLEKIKSHNYDQSDLDRVNELIGKCGSVSFGGFTE